MNLSLGHPARWLDVAAAKDELESRYECLVSWELYITWDVGLEPMVHADCVVVPSVAGVNRKRDVLKRSRKRRVGKGFSVTELLYTALWECSCSVELLWQRYAEHAGAGVAARPPWPPPDEK